VNVSYCDLQNHWELYVCVYVCMCMSTSLGVTTENLHGVPLECGHGPAYEYVGIFCECDLSVCWFALLDDLRLCVYVYVCISVHIHAYGTRDTCIHKNVRTST
jgi:hypothetical protein